MIDYVYVHTTTWIGATLVWNAPVTGYWRPDKMTAHSISRPARLPADTPFIQTGAILDKRALYMRIPSLITLYSFRFFWR